jgi:hypothetical protein
MTEGAGKGGSQQQNNCFDAQKKRSVIQKHVGAVTLARFLQFRNENSALSF